MRTPKLYGFLIRIISLISLIILSNCSASIPGDNTATATSAPTVPVSPINHLTPSESAVQKPTVTANGQKLAPTIRPTLTGTQSPVPSITPTPPWTPIPTLLPPDQQRIIENYFADIGGCEIPCWWKITPGLTTWEQARQILSPLATEDGPYFPTRLPKYYFTFQQPTESFLGFELVVWVDDDRVVAVLTNSKWIKPGIDASLAGLLKVFGQPEQVWVQAADFPSTLEPPYQLDVPYQLELFYPHRGMLIWVHGTALLTEKSVTLCPQKKGKYDNGYPPGILLFSNQEDKDYEKLTADLFGDRAGANPNFIFRRLSTVTNGFDEEKFYKIYSDKQSEVCIEIGLERLNQ